MKQSQNNNFDQFVKGKLENASVTPPAFIWSKIERELPPVLPWYSKYKYLLLLLFLCFTSGSAILTYKFIKDNKHGNIAANKTRVTDENSNTEINNTQATGNTTDKTASAATTTANSDALSSKKTITTVSSFYSNNKNDSSLSIIKTGSAAKSALEKRNNRVERFAVNSTSTVNNITINKSENNLSGTVKSKKEKNTIGKLNTTTNNNVEPVANDVFTHNITTASSSEIATGKQDRKKIKKEIKSKDVLASNLIAVNSINNNDYHLPVLENNSIGVNVNSPIDISPIAEPVRAKESEEFTASVTPLKLNTTPLNSRDVMRSLIEPAKLEMLDFEASAGVEDLNPNKEKMMRNLKQFAGYNINQGFHIGVFISINNIWLSNKEFSCSENVSNIKPKFDFGKSYGLNIGYDYSDRWGIELEAQYAEQGQKYTETSVSNNTSKEVNLNYLKLPLMVKYKQSFINSYNSKPIVMSFLFGPQMGFLLKKEARVDGKSVACTQAYSKVETGLAAGIDFDLYMMRYMYLTIGARTGFGTSFKKGVPVSYQIGVTTQFNFRIPKKFK